MRGAETSPAGDEARPGLPWDRAPAPEPSRTKGVWTAGGRVEGDGPVHSPVRTSLGTDLCASPISSSGVMMLSMFPNMDDRPKVKSIPKKSTAQPGAPGMCSTASVKMMKASPVPAALCNTGAL